MSIEELSLEELAATINREHGLAYRAALDVLHHAILCGEALIAARATVPEGGWTQWVTANLTVSSRSVGTYIRVATYKEQLLSADQQPTTIAAAVTYLRDAPPVSNGRPGTRPTFDVAEARRLREQGLTYRDVGALLGVSRKAVELQLTPGARRKAMDRSKRYWRRRQAERRALGKQEQREERDRLAKTTGGELAEAYALVRRTISTLDRAGQSAAVQLAHRLEDEIVRALKQSRAADQADA